MPIRYARICTHDGKVFIIRVTSDTAAAISGVEVDKQGEEIVPPGHHNRLRITEKGAIRSCVELRMNNHYAMLEAV